MIHDLGSEGPLGAAILLFEEMCHLNGHPFCGGTKACEDELRRFGIRAAQSDQESRFDPGRAARSFGESLPDFRWPTAALVHVVRHGTLSQPDADGLRRATWITTALARLAERGIATDPLMRRWLGPVLARHVMTIAATLWLQIRSATLTLEVVRPQIRGWLALVEEDCADRTRSNLGG